MTDDEVRTLIAFGRHVRAHGMCASAEAAQIAAWIGGVPRLGDAAVADALTLLAHFGLLRADAPLRLPAPITARFRLSSAGLDEIVRRCGQSGRGARCGAAAGRLSPVRLPLRPAQTARSR